MPDGDIPSSFSVSIDYATFTNKRPANNDAILQLDDQPAPKTSATNFDDIFPALALILCCIMYTSQRCAVRFTANAFHLSVDFIAFYSSVLTTLLSFVLLLRYYKSIFSNSLSTNEIRSLLLRAFVGAASVILHYAAVARLPLAIATCIFCQRPIFASALGFLLLGEKLTTTDYVSIVVSTMGSILVAISEPESDMSGSNSRYIQGVILGLLATFSSCVVYVLMRSMGTRVHFVLSTWLTSLALVLISLPFYFAENGGVVASFASFPAHLNPSHGHALVYLLGVGAFALVGDLAMNCGTQLLPAGRSALLKTADIPISFVIGFLFLAEVPESPMQILGCAMITFSAILTARKGRR